jgi:hypothetical protein
MTYANKKAILKVVVIMILGVVVASATISAGVLADAPAESAYSDILNNTNGDGSSSNPHVVTTLDELQAVQGELSAEYILDNNIDASETDTWNSGAGFTTIGNLSNSFSGSFNGQGYTIDGLYINRPDTINVGLFGGVNTTIKNIGVTNIDIQGDIYVGGLVGYTKGGAIITNSYSSGDVSGDDHVGGLVGANTNTTIEKSYSHSNVSGNNAVGGLVGDNNNGANIMETYSTGLVTGNTNVGGLVGTDYAKVTDSYWNSEISTQSTSASSATGLTTAEMTGSAAETNMVNLDFTSVWRTVSASDADSSADSYPILDSSEEEEDVIFSESSSEESGGMSTLVSASVVAFFGIFIMVLLLFGKD